MLCDICACGTWLCKLFDEECDELEECDECVTDGVETASCERNKDGFSGLSNLKSSCGATSLAAISPTREGGLINCGKNT